MFFFRNKHDTFVRRMSMAKGLGLLIGALGAFMVLPWYFRGATIITPHFQWGMFLWYVTFGGLIGLVGVVKECPFFGKKSLFTRSDFWRPILRGGGLGAWLNLVLSVLMYDQFASMIATMNLWAWADWHVFVWAIVEGFIVGSIIDAVATRFGGEGKTLL